jgi:NAD(P)-dependent dehydrogenase (short-subunit alcohol dehydrogenase family)
MEGDKMMLSNRVAVITGGAKGIGRGIALKFASEGCSVAVVDILEERARKTAGEVSKMGVKGISLKCDVTNAKQVHTMVAEVIKEFGKIDILVNNAGAMFGSYSAWELPEENWNKTLDLNLKSNYLCTKEVIPFMKEKRYGKIINLSAIGAIYPPAGALAYSSAKAGVLGLTFDLALELGEFNIRVNAILPGAIPTDFWRLPPGADLEKIKEIEGKRIVLGRVGTPEDVAKVALFFASELADYVTGSYLIVGGGMPLARTVNW